MEIEYEFNKLYLKGDGNNGFLITDRKGSFFSFGMNSKYDGFFSLIDDYPHKSIYNIVIDSSPKKIINRFSSIERIHDNCKERFRVIDNAMIYEIREYEGELKLILDVRKIFENPNFGRIHKIYLEGEEIIIEYLKYTDETLSQLEYKLFVVISGISSFEEIGRWIRIYNEYDASRNDNPEQYVYEALKMRINREGRLIFLLSDSKEKALAKIRYMKQYFKDVVEKEEKYLRKKLHYPDLERNCALNALYSLILENNNIEIVAGLPWFFQEWLRDEVMSLGALIQEKEYSCVKNILMRYISLFGRSAKLPVIKKEQKLGSDGVGLVCFRMLQFIQQLEKEKKVFDYFSLDELKSIHSLLCMQISLVEKRMIKKGLFWSEPLESWMDTCEYGSSREGACVEIQALTLCMYELEEYLARLFNKKSFSNRKEKILQKVREKMVVDGVLVDIFTNSASKIARPNVFLAYYFYPQLITKKEWIKTFDNALKDLWLEWGGFSSISKNSDMFSARDDGILNRAYHGGDSWYFINNIAAIAMYSLDKKRYNKYIKKIKHASLIDMLFLGYIGMCSEISSSSIQEPRGCWNQAWSNATLLELMNKIR